MANFIFALCISTVAFLESDAWMMMSLSISGGREDRDKLSIKFAYLSKNGFCWMRSSILLLRSFPRVTPDERCCCSCCCGCCSCCCCCCCCCSTGSLLPVHLPRLIEAEVSSASACLAADLIKALPVCVLNNPCLEVLSNHSIIFLRQWRWWWWR